MIEYMFLAFSEMFALSIAQDYVACVAACATVCYAIHLVRKAVR